MSTASAAVPVGYKQTEVGVIPQDWKIITIKSLIKKKIIKSHLDGNHGELYPRSEEFSHHGIPYITANDFLLGTINFNSVRYLPKSRAEKFQKGVAKNGDVLFAHNATVGPTAVLNTNLEYVILSTTATYFRTDPNQLNNYFLKYFLESSYFVKQYSAVMYQSTRNQVPITQQRKFSILLPKTIKEQKSISQVLTDSDSQIRILENLIQKKQYIKQGTMQELLTGKTRLPGFSDEWGTFSLNDVVSNFTTGLNPRQNFKLNNGGNLFYVTIKNFTQGVLNLDDNCDKINIDAFNIIQKRSDLRQNDILFSSIGRIGDCYLIEENPTNWNTNESVFSLRPNKNMIIPNFLCHLMNGIIKKKFQDTSTGSTFKSIKMASLKSTKLLIPISLLEQEKIAILLSDMDAEIAALEQRLEKAKAIKQGMMQQLLTGKIRLVD